MITENIRQLCKNRETSFWALERELGLGNGTIAKWSSRSPRVESLKLVADYFGVTVDDLLKENTDQQLQTAEDS